MVFWESTLDERFLMGRQCSLLRCQDLWLKKAFYAHKTHPVIRLGHSGCSEELEERYVLASPPV